MGTIIVLRDVTREALSDRLKDHFITAISHELRTPMAVIKGVSEMIIASETLPNRKLLETLSRNVDVLDRMIVELLDISELNSDSFSIRHELINLEELIWHRRQGASAGDQARAVGRFAADPRGDRSWSSTATISGCAGHSGICSKTRSATPKAAGNRDHGIARRRRQNIAVQFVDTGVGIIERDLPHIFEQFYRGEARSSSGKLIDPRGLGQGLFIARRVLEAHGGYVTVNSTRGQGSIFTVVLPRAACVI